MVGGYVFTSRVDRENAKVNVIQFLPGEVINCKETRGYPTGYLRVQSDTIKYNRESREVG